MAASDNAPKGLAGPRCSIADVIEDMGLGPAQLRTVLLAGSVPLGMGSYLATLSLITASVAAEFGVSEVQQTLVTMLVYVSMLLGGLIGGRLADRLGRRCAITLAAFALAAFGIVASLSLCWAVFVLCFLVLGFAMGLGYPASCALVSEVSPKAWRTTTRAACDILFDVGFIFSALLATWQDPVLYDLHWRTLVAWSSAPCLILGPIALLLLSESPAFLAATGKQAAAREELMAMGRLNGVEPCGVSFQLPSKAEGLSWGVLSRKYANATATLAYASFVLSILYTSGSYLQSQVQTQGSHDLVGGWQMVGSGGIDIIALTICAWFARHLPRSLALEIALIGGAIVVWCYAAGNSAPGRNMLTEMVRQSGILGFYWVPALGFLALYQTAVEAYPTTLASTGAAVVLGAGRLGAILTPDLLSKFQAMTGHVHSVCYIIGVGCAVGAVLVHVTLPRNLAQALEASPLLVDSAPRKAAAADA